MVQRLLGFKVFWVSELAKNVGHENHDVNNKPMRMVK